MRAVPKLDPLSKLHLSGFHDHFMITNRRHLKWEVSLLGAISLPHCCVRSADPLPRSQRSGVSLNILPVEWVH